MRLNKGQNQLSLIAVTLKDEDECTPVSALADFMLNGTASGVICNVLQVMSKVGFYLRFFINSGAKKTNFFNSPPSRNLDQNVVLFLLGFVEKIMKKTEISIKKHIGRRCHF